MRLAISSCLLGENCKYSGGNNACAELIAFVKGHEVLKICPEVLGGLPIPRAPAEICGDKVMNTNGEDVTKQFVTGAKIALSQVLAFQPDMVILQPRSPSCGIGRIYDGSFKKRLIDGNGIFVEMLRKEKISAMTCGKFLEEMRVLSSKPCEKP